MIARTTCADPLHQAGQAIEAEARFVEAETMQAAQSPSHPLLYSLRGFQYCDLLLGEAEPAAWRRLVAGSDNELATSLPLDACGAVSERATRTLGWMQAWSGASLIDIGLDHLTLARAAMYQAILRGGSPPAEHVGEAVGFQRRGGRQEHLPPCLLTRALFRATTGDFDGAAVDLDDAHEIAERGPMRLHLAGIHLHRARLFGLMANRPKDYPWISPPTTSTRRGSSLTLAAMKGGATSFGTPRPPGTASTGLRRKRRAKARASPSIAVIRVRSDPGIEAAAAALDRHVALWAPRDDARAEAAPRPLTEIDDSNSVESRELRRSGGFW